MFNSESLGYGKRFYTIRLNCTPINTMMSDNDFTPNEWNRIFSALSAEPRRQLLTSLVESSPGQSVPLPEGAVTPNDDVDPAELKVRLYHNDLPMLADAEYIQWTTEPLTASRGPQFHKIECVIESIRSPSTLRRLRN